MANPPPLYDYEKTYCFVDVPGVGYAVNISPFSFGIAGQERDPPVALFLREEKQRSELEKLIVKEANKSTWQTILHGIGDNSRYYHPGAAILLGVCSTPFMCPIHIALAFSVGLPLAGIRYLQKKSTEKMTKWIANAPAYEARVQPMQEYLTKQGIEEKIQSYTRARTTLGFTGQLKALVNEPAELKQQRLELAHAFSTLYEISTNQVFTLRSDSFYAPRVSMDVYAFMRNVYEGKWLKHQKQVIFARPVEGCSQCEH